MNKELVPDDKVKGLAALIDPLEFEGLLRDGAERFYSKLLYLTQDHLRENAEFNLQADIDALRGQIRAMSEHLDAIAKALGVSRHDPEGQLRQIEFLKARVELHAQARAETAQQAPSPDESAVPQGGMRPDTIQSAQPESTQ